MEIYIKLFEVLFPVFFVVGIGYYLGKTNPKIDTTFKTSDSSPKAVIAGKALLPDLELPGKVCDPTFVIALLFIPTNEIDLIFELLSASDTTTASDAEL